MNQSIKIDPFGFREYDARWIYEKDINIKGISNLGKGLGTQIIKHTKKNNPRVIVGHDYRSYSEEIKSALIQGLVSKVYYFLKLLVFLTKKQSHFGFQHTQKVFSLFYPLHKIIPWF